MKKVLIKKEGKHFSQKGFHSLINLLGKAGFLQQLLKAGVGAQWI